MKAAVPDVYNGFNAERAFDNIEDAFGSAATIHIAREGSVCLYIRPTSGAVWLSRTTDIGKIADEVSFVPDLGMFRLWWD